MKTQVIALACALALTATIASGVIAWRNREHWVVGDFGAVLVRNGRPVSTLAHASWTRLPTAVSHFEMDTGASVAQLTDLVRNPGVAGWKGPYAGSLDDLWGTPVRLESNGTRRVIRSAGQDRVFATRDDATMEL